MGGRRRRGGGVGTERGGHPLSAFAVGEGAGPGTHHTRTGREAHKR